MTDGTRPNRYSRGYDLIKNTNTSLEGSNGIRLGDSKIFQRVHLHYQAIFLKHFCFILNVGRCNM